MGLLEHPAALALLGLAALLISLAVSGVSKLLRGGGSGERESVREPARAGHEDLLGLPPPRAQQAATRSRDVAVNTKPPRQGKGGRRRSAAAEPSRNGSGGEQPVGSGVILCLNPSPAPACSLLLLTSFPHSQLSSERPRRGGGASAEPASPAQGA